jgi:hypothetical protein
VGGRKTADGERRGRRELRDAGRSWIAQRREMEKVVFGVESVWWVT